MERIEVKLTFFISFCLDGENSNLNSIEICKKIVRNL